MTEHKYIPLFILLLFGVILSCASSYGDLLLSDGFYTIYGQQPSQLRSIEKNTIKNLVQKYSIGDEQDYDMIIPVLQSAVNNYDRIVVKDHQNKEMHIIKYESGFYDIDSYAL